MGEPVRIGIIGGGGWLGRAIVEAIIDAQIVAAEHLTLSYRSGQSGFLPNATWTRDNQELVDRSEVIIVSVRPQDWPAIDISAHGKLAMSVMAGIPVDQLASRLKTDRIVRTLPNAAAEVRNSYTPWIGSEGITLDDRNLVRRILAACGAADEVKSEADIDYLTGLTGSGPAFPALLAAAMMDDAIGRGMSPDMARRSVSAVLIGTGKLLEARGENPKDIVQTFLDYRGTTAAAIEAMRASGFEAAVGDGLAAALQKSVSMGQAS
ncbi:MAG: pyrroline-5-carboxylate reductase [Mesorhizobium sp.]|uniref:pyrroline-5-carboxylate reductase family protein n=2 Tax=unclassified Mesorhizobium TaxID=325217 RepID=UPI000FE8FB69|nr:pyrroline-5-carboxylate reductase dimerization domain-containing protein [Mesorhizobium sp.]RWD01974.1 MAG: pyrroline-5-carboxylate reductase [Mesorhizobium sp.]RWD28047.1 MAG: pyrroline-5-carboxylate reductase [Mesorhizobium sp.]RWD34535.1 MAG: pyrroline-5-carboxylate reductase [Mesorhizobium sp.]TIT91703.1 MAG: pyrroline-5-carboxylate reductase [Mesorhizobium sp.]TIW27204.1 MAG: pyrroline-5-carboxylate reductase [Mesorhizobium sp.]